MIKHNQDGQTDERGAVNGLAVSLILSILFLIGALGVAAWAMAGRQDYKNNVDQKVAAAVATAKQQESATKDLQFAEEAKKPLKIYKGPEAYGSINLSYPKTWSGYVDTASSSNAAVDGYFNPGVVPSVDDQSSVFALHVRVLNQKYSEVLQSLSSQVQEGKLTTAAYTLPKLPKIVGIKATGEITEQKTATMIVLPLRSQTVQIWTDGTQYLDDFNNNILPNFSFSP